MTADRWGRLKSLFGQAVALDEPAQDEFIRAIPDLDADMEGRLRSLVRHHDSAPAILEGPLISQERMIEYLAAGARTFQVGEIAGGRFRIERFVGEGGMGEVYAAEDLDLGEMVALKTLRPCLSSNSELVQRFKQEIQIARRVTHGNVCRVFDLFWHHVESSAQSYNIAFLTMELIDGETLEERIRRDGRIGEKDALPIARQIVAGLSSAHAAGIVHRDFKSGNILLSNEAGTMRVVITDFGLAQLTADEAAEPGVRPIEGTVAYLAPEQIVGGALTSATDIYALGVVLFEMATGTLPFPAAATWEEAKRQRDTPPAPRTRVPDLDAKWEAAISRCLESDPGRRPASGGAVLRMIEGHKLAGRRWALAALGVAAATAGAWALEVRSRPKALRPEAFRHLKRAEEFAQRRNLDAYQNAIAEYKRVIALEPNYAPAWVGLADVYSDMNNFNFMDTREALAEAKRAAARAIELDGNLAKAQGVFGRIVSLDLSDWVHAEPYFQRAVSLDPRDTLIRLWYGAHLGKLRRPREAIEQIRSGLDQAPVSMPLNHQLSTELFRARRFAEFLDQARDVVRLQPFEASSYLVLARALEWQRRYEEALRSCDEADRLKNTLTGPSYRASIEAARGNQDAARKIALNLREYWSVKPFESGLLAGLFAQIGDLPGALEILNQGYSRQDSTILTAPANPYFGPFLPEPEFQRFLVKILWPGASAR